MPDGVFELAVLTPEQELLHTDARALVYRSSDGDLTILDGHTPLVTDVVPGDVRVDPEEGEPVHMAVHGGYVQVETGEGVGGREGRSTRVTLLAGIAELARDIDVARAQRAREEAEGRLEQLRSSGVREDDEAGEDTGRRVELHSARASLRRAEVRLEVAGERSS